MIFKGFKKGIFPIHHDDEDSRFEDEEEDIRDRNGLIDCETLDRLVDLKGRDINDELFRGYFKYQVLSHMLENLKHIKGTQRNENEVNLIKRALTELKNKIKNMSKYETEIEQLNEIKNIVEKNIEFNKQSQQGQGLKVLTPSQMLSRLTISLAQLNAGNNSEKRNQTIIVIFLQKLTKTIYKTLIHII